MHMTTHNSRRAFLTASIAAVVTTVHSQSWPQRPIKLIVLFGPGGGADIVARIYADKLSMGLGQPVVVENKAGASGLIAAEFVIHAAPDVQSSSRVELANFIDNERAKSADLLVRQG
jgi:tripartite-type tricarboxylate transporter receptor subunit TctC